MRVFDNLRSPIGSGMTVKVGVTVEGGMTVEGEMTVEGGMTVKGGMTEKGGMEATKGEGWFCRTKNFIYIAKRSIYILQNEEIGLRRGAAEES